MLGSLLAAIFVICVPIALSIRIVWQFWVKPIEADLRDVFHELDTLSMLSKELKNAKEKGFEYHRRTTDCFDKVIVEFDLLRKNLRNEVRDIANRMNAIEYRDKQASDEIAKGHRDQAKQLYLLMTDLQRIFGMMAAEYKPGALPKHAPLSEVVGFRGFDKLESVEKDLRKPVDKVPVQIKDIISCSPFINVGEPCCSTKGSPSAGDGGCAAT